MDQKTFTILAGVIFAAVALLHVLRILMGWPAAIGGWAVPMWLSWVAACREVPLTSERHSNAPQQFASLFDYLSSLIGRYWSIAFRLTESNNGQRTEQQAYRLGRFYFTPAFLRPSM